ncbi:MAG: GNAT family N-acetyltransferase [Limnochordia bacterium]|jgi:GNAT superfamily N-acetyltransferase|nr:GNAT family N-acetyltransferase [Bacillota bacterium]NLL09008.1 GNAT family N-acetyltransferase [Bacillota bacterium]HBG10406.1 GNAT family N-acetyltransferase [Bacillota bacterium]
MALYKVADKSTIAPLFADRQDTMIWSCLQDCMGEAYADDLAQPQSAAIYVADFCYFAGKVNTELIATKPEGYTGQGVLMVPPDSAWQAGIEAVYGERARPWIRYATKQDMRAFDRRKLAQLAERLPAGFELQLIDQRLYEQILALPWAWYLCGNFASYHQFAANALGVVILHGGEPVSGASAYAFYRGGIEVEIDTREDYRRRGLATICGAALILKCLERGLYPNWDAHTRESLALAQKLGYVFDREYLCYGLYPW